MLLEQRRLAVTAALPLAGGLVGELQGLRARNTVHGRPEFEAAADWRSAPYGYLVLAVAAWRAEHQAPPWGFA